MGKRVHVIKRHEDYGETEAFNWQFEEFNNFLGQLGCDMWHEEDIYDRFECGVDDYKTALSLVKAYKKKGRVKSVVEMFDDANADIDEFENRIDGLGGLDYVLNAMQVFYNERDKKTDWISFAVW